MAVTSKQPNLMLNCFALISINPATQPSCSIEPNTRPNVLIKYIKVVVHSNDNRIFQNNVALHWNILEFIYLIFILTSFNPTTRPTTFRGREVLGQPTTLGLYWMSCRQKQENSFKNIVTVLYNVAKLSPSQCQSSFS